MATVPEPYLSACLQVVHSAILEARLIGWHGEDGGLSARQSAQLGALMDAVHNIPELLQRWETCDEPLLRAFLEEYDEKWQGGLLATYLGRLAT